MPEYLTFNNNLLAKCNSSNPSPRQLVVVIKDPGPILSVEIIYLSLKDEYILFLLKGYGSWTITILKHSHFVLFMERG